MNQPIRFLLSLILVCLTTTAPAAARARVASGQGGRRRKGVALRLGAPVFMGGNPTPVANRLRF
jgi:hypothetical protein